GRRDGARARRVGRARGGLRPLARTEARMTHAERWLAATWRVVRAALPAPPARVVELGCGRVGGHVPAMRAAGYDALGVDPEAPTGDEYRRIEFELLDEGAH